MSIKKFAILMVFVLAALPIVSGCTPAAPTPAEPAAPEPAQPAAPAVEEKKMRMALVMMGTHDDGTWNAMAWEGAQKLKEQGWELAYSESVMDADVARVLRNYANEGYNYIWAHSGTYPNAVMEVAKEFPDVSFAGPTSPDLEFPPMFGA